MISDCETHATKSANSHRSTENSDRDLSFETTLWEWLCWDIQSDFSYDKWKRRDINDWQNVIEARMNWTHHHSSSEKNWSLTQWFLQEMKSYDLRITETLWHSWVLFLVMKSLWSSSLLNQSFSVFFSHDTFMITSIWQIFFLFLLFKKFSLL